MEAHTLKKIDKKIVRKFPRDVIFCEFQGKCDFKRALLRRGSHHYTRYTICVWKDRCTQQTDQRGLKGVAFPLIGSQGLSSPYERRYNGGTTIRGKTHRQRGSVPNNAGMKPSC